MITPDFQTTYTVLRKQLSETDYLTKYLLLGAEIQDKALIIPFYGTAYRISGSGVTTLTGTEVNPAIAVVLCQYVLRCPQDISPSSEELVTFREFEGSGPLSGYFVENTQKLISGAFIGNISALEARCRQLNGTLHADNTAAYDLGVQFYALPRIPVILCFNDSDAEFPAQCAILFKCSAELFLDLQSLCVCATFLAGSLIGD